jgi:hypothetical protein
MIRRCIAFALLAGCATLSLAQLRTIPEDAKRGTMRHVQEMTVDIDGTQQQLAAGAQIRDTENRIVVPTAVPPGTLVKYRLDGEGRIWRVWFLTPQEAAQADKDK